MTERNPGPYAIICAEHGQVFLLNEEYDFQMSRPDSYWRCPLCGEDASWDDYNYGDYLDELEGDF